MDSTVVLNNLANQYAISAGNFFACGDREQAEKYYAASEAIKALINTIPRLAPATRSQPVYGRDI